MQPLNTITSPSSGSRRGWSPRELRSMIFSRRCTSATPSWCQSPAPSGPRGASVSAIRASASRSGARAHAISPPRPHIRVLYPQAGRATRPSRSGRARRRQSQPPRGCHLSFLGGFDELPEQRELGGVIDQRLGVPLNSQHRPFLLGFDGLDHAVWSPRNRTQATAKVLDALMVKGVHGRTRTAQDRRQPAAGGDPDLVRDLAAGRLLAVLDGAVGGIWKVLVEGPATRDAERLGSAADSENRQSPRVGLARQLHFEGIELALRRAKLGMRGASVAGRVEVGISG